MELNRLYRMYHRLSSSIQGQLLTKMDSIARSLCFLTQFISSHRLDFLFKILFILSVKKICFVFLTIFLNFFQSFKLWDCWYLLISVQQSLFYHALKYLVILAYLEYLSQVLLILKAST